MKVVLDTNAFISCIGKASPWRRVFDGFLREHYTLCLSAEVLLEYEEKFEEFWGDAVTTNLLGRILTASNTSLHIGGSRRGRQQVCRPISICLG